MRVDESGVASAHATSSRHDETNVSTLRRGEGHQGTLTGGPWYGRGPSCPRAMLGGSYYDEAGQVRPMSGAARTRTRAARTANERVAPERRTRRSRSAPWVTTSGACAARRLGPDDAVAQPEHVVRTSLHRVEHEPARRGALPRLRGAAPTIAASENVAALLAVRSITGPACQRAARPPRIGRPGRWHDVLLGMRRGRGPRMAAPRSSGRAYARTSFRYCTRCGWSASGPFRRFRSSM